MKQVYNAGHCLIRGAQMQRMAEKEEILAVNPKLKFYNPMENKAINDKANAVQLGLADRIVKHDTHAIMASDIIVIEPLPEACGTMVELGQLLGMKDFAHLVLESSCNPKLSATQALSDIITLCNGMINKKVYPHYEDIRRVDGITETGDDRSLGINQYVKGACNKLTNGKGFYSWDEVLEELALDK